ncbi:MAG: glycosyltransferase [Nitrospirales bacterium]
MYVSDVLSVLHTGICIVFLIGIGVLSWQRKGKQAIICGTVALCAQYMIWRGLYTLDLSVWDQTLISCIVYVAEAYGFVQLGFFAFQVWETTERHPPVIRTHATVDILVPIVNEPLYILRRTLVCCLNQHYPKEKYRVYVLDDGHREDVQHLAEALGCHYLRRSNRTHAKAGNLNHALALTAGELIAVFDTDHAPAASFLANTVGFFEQEKVAFVQTPQHFYNADIFQSNLCLGSNVPNEQALFFRVLQPGRDSSNSAFFAGSGGVFRRTTLTEIGGFQTETITEDIHTSLLVHSKGYESRYLNRPLAAGLMPETFESHLKQRARWAMGTWQMFFRSNPLTLSGLTWAQRINYLAAVWYFGFGLPRLICLMAPALGLLFGFAPVNASLWEFGIYYGSYFVASLLMMKAVSRGTRIALWSEVYEIAMCFRMSWAVLTTLIQPFRERPFVITPKGLQQGSRHFSIQSVLPHFAVIALLLLGLGWAAVRWHNASTLPGVGITIAWTSINLVFLCIAVIASIDAQQWRKITRIPRKVPCTVLIGTDLYDGMTEDLSETGALIHLPPAAQAVGKDQIRKECSMTLGGAMGAVLNLKVQLASQRSTVSGKAAFGVNFINADEKTIQALIAVMFGNENIWNQVAPQSGIWRNLWWLLCVMRVPFSLSRASFRLSRRIPCHRYCQGIFSRHTLGGTVINISEDGLLADFAGTIQQLGEEGTIHIDHCVIQVRRMWSQARDGNVLVGFRIQCIKEGELYWQELLSSAGGSGLSTEKAA